MKKILTIARWEFIEKVKRKSFIISMIVTPLVLFGLVYFSSSFISLENTPPSPVGILDMTGNFESDIIRNLNHQTNDEGTPLLITLNLMESAPCYKAAEALAERMLHENDIYGVVYISGSAPDSLHVLYKDNGLTSPEVFAAIEQAVKNSILSWHLNQLDLSSSTISNMLSNIELLRINESTNQNSDEDDFIKTFLTGYFFILLLLVMILFSGGMFVRSIVEEKENRIVEVLLSSCNIDELLTGKILGLSILGFFQIALWIFIGGVLLNNEFIQLSFSGTFWWQILYFILGYVLYTSIFVGVGSVVNTEHEAQQTTTTLSIFLSIPILIASQVLLYPDSIISQVLSYFPLTTSPAMILRLNVIHPPFIELFSTILLSIVTIYFVIVVSSKMFKIGVLSYGKKTSLKKLLFRSKQIND